MSNRRLDISSLLCNDDDLSPHRPRPTPAPPTPQQPIPSSATPKLPYLGLEALVHVATEERRRLSGGSESLSSRHDSPIEDHSLRPYSYQPTHQAHQTSPKQLYAPVVASPVITQSPTYSPFLQRSREHVQMHQSPVEQRSPMLSYARPEEELQRYQYQQRQRQEIVLQEQRPHHQRPPHTTYPDTSRIMLPPLRPPPQVEDTEQLHSRMGPLSERPRSGSFAPKYPLSPMQLDMPVPVTFPHGSPRLHTPITREPPVLSNMSQPILRELVTPSSHEIQPTIYHDHATLYRREAPSTSTIAQDIPPPSHQTTYALHSPLQRTVVGDDFPPNKRRRHSDSPMRLPAIVQNMGLNEPAHVREQKVNVHPLVTEGEVELPRSVSQSIPPPIAATSGPIIAPRRSSHEATKKPPSLVDLQARERESHKMASVLGRRSPPGSAVGRAKAAKKIDEMEKNLREAIKRDQIASPVPLKPRDEAGVTAILQAKPRTEGKELFVDATPVPPDSNTKQEDTRGWPVQQFNRLPSPPHPTSATSSLHGIPIPTPVDALPSSSHNSASPILADKPCGPPSPVPMSEEAVATLEQELEELLAEPQEAEENRMDVDIDNDVMQLVVDTFDNGEAEEDEGDYHTNQRESYVSEADVDLELLRLVDDQPSDAATTGQSRQGSEVFKRTASPHLKPVEPSLADIDHVLIHASPDAVPTQSERGSMPPPVPLATTSKGNDQLKHGDENLAGKKASKASAGSKKKEMGIKSSKPKTTSVPVKQKAKSVAKPKAKTTEGTATPPLSAPKPSKALVPPPVKKSVSSTAASRSRSASAMPSVGPEGEGKTAERQEEEESSDTGNEDDKLYCVCNTKYDEERCMIACDKCDEWYHMQCVDIPELEVDLVDQFFCPLCIQRNPYLSLRTTYKQRCLNGLKHSNPKSPDACHKPALGGGILSKFCSQDCGVEHMANRIDAWVKKGGKREKLWESVKDAERREGVVIQVDRPNPRIAEITVKTEDSKPMVVENQVKEEAKSVVEKLQVRATKSTLEIERLRIVLARVVKMREEIKKGMEVVLWREQLLELATERAQVVGQCGWDQRLCFGDEEWAEFGMGILESYENKEGSTTERDNDMQVDGPGVSEDGEWWCPGKTVCDRHAGWQNIRAKDISKEKEQKEEALAKLTTRERELRKRIEDLVDPHGPDVKDTPRKKPSKLSNSNGHSRAGAFVQKGKKRKSIIH